MKKLFEYVGKWKKYILFASMCMMISSILGLVPYFALNEILVSFVNQNIETKYLILLCFIILLGYIGKAVFTAIGMSLSHKAAFGVLLNIRKKYAFNMINHPMGQIIKNGVGRYKKGFVEDVELMETSLAHLIPEGIPYVITVLLIYTLMFFTDWRLALCALAVLPLSMIVMTFMSVSGSKRMPNYYASIDKLNSTIIEYINGMEVVKMFNKTNKAFNKYEKSVVETRDFTYDWYKSSWVSSSLLYSILPASLLFVLPTAFIFYKNESLSFSNFTWILILNIALSEPLIKLVEFTPNIPQVSFAFNKLEQTFSSEPLKTGTINSLPSNYNIEIKNITFAYEENNIFENFSLNIKQGESISIVGESGSGKSTLAKLLTHFWDVKSGQITIGGVDITDYTSETLMDIISYVSQDTFLFSGSIMENLLMGNKNLTEEQVINACKNAHCHNFISSLPNGYDTQVGNFGKKLSGGERQRLTIVRAILKNAPIVILDEATSHTDAENEKNIQLALNSLLKNKTVIKISHRIDLINSNDKIVVMNKGKIDATGTHDEVIKTSSIYNNLYSRNISALNWNIKTKLSSKEGEHA